jgi:uncharacterized membrane protein YheB (UPF0754 family)
MLNQLFLSVLSGSLTGYVTNDFAIKMLFKEYFGLGGVIEKEYEKFIKGISELVEEQFVNHSTLSNYLHSTDFNRAVQQVVEDIISIHLPNNSGSLKICDIEEIETTKTKICNSLNKDISNLTNELLHIISSQKLDLLISNEQWQYISHNISKILKEERYVKYIEEMLDSFLEDKEVSMLISRDTLKKLAFNISDSIKSIELANFDSSINKAFSKLEKALDIDKPIKEIEEKVKEMHFKEFINDYNDLSRELIKRISKFLSSEKGTLLLEKLVNHLLDSAENIEVSIADIFEDDIYERLYSFLEEILPSFMGKVISLLVRRKQRIEKLIEESIDDGLSVSIRGKIALFFKDILWELNTGTIFEEILESVEEYGEENAPEVLANEILSFLQNNNIGEIIRILREKRILNTHLVVRMIQKNTKNIPIRNNEIIENFLNKKK